MFVHNINPVLFSMGPFEIRWYGLIWVLGFFLAYWVLKKKKEALNVTDKDLDNFLLVLMISVVVGARIFHVLFWGPSYYFSHPEDILAVWKGGLAFHGGLLGSALAVWWFSKKHKIPFLKLADILSIPGGMGLALGRVANFINGELWGQVTNVAWCVKFQAVEGCRHPYPLYAALGRFLSVAILWKLDQKDYKEGSIFAWFLILFGIVRIVADVWRVDTTYFFLTAGQWFSILMVIVGMWLLHIPKQAKSASH